MDRMKFWQWMEAKSRVILMDGGMGTLLAEKGWKPPMLPEEMNLSSPGIVASIHESYIDAGSDIIETNSFGGSTRKLSHRNLQGRTREINRAAAKIAKECAKERALVAGSVGPLGELLEPFGSLTFEEAYEAFYEQIVGLAEGGADFILIETMMDLREAKAAVAAAKDAAPNHAFVVSFTFDHYGKTVTGTPPEVAAAWAYSVGAAGVGANCGVGPAEYVETVKTLWEYSRLPVFVYANAGLPGDDDFWGPEAFAEKAKELALAGATVVGGCCGTTPEHIQKMREALADINRRPLSQKKGTFLASRSKLVPTGKGAPLLVVGERINVSRKSALKDQVAKRDFTLLKEEARIQAQAGADVIDVNVGLPGEDQVSLMSEAISAVEGTVEVPVSIDSDKIEVLEAGLKRASGVPLINSVTAKQGHLEKGLELASRYGAVLTVLPMDGKSLPHTIEERKAVIDDIVKRARLAGFPMENLVIDGLTLAVGADDNAPKVTLKALEYIAEQGCLSILGVSNVSHGLPSRHLVNRTFLAMAMAAGLDAAIIDPIAPGIFETILASNLLRGSDPKAETYINSQDKLKERALVEPNKVLAPKDDTKEAKEDVHGKKVKEGQYAQLIESIIEGDEEGAKAIVQQLLDEEGLEPMDVISSGIIPALEEVGELYESGEFFLPQLLASAQAAQASCDLAKSHMEPSAQGENKGTIVLATVEGDLHDLGKGIVGTVLRSYGFEVIDLGRNVPAKKILEAASEVKAHVVGLSALMTTTMEEMARTVTLLKENMPDLPVIVGGASVSESFAKKIGSDGTAPDAIGAVRLVTKLIERGGE